MEISMGPPVVPGYSLRVMLFTAHAYGSDARPIRCFRVVTSPDVSVREFCQEASRIHEINYGEPIAIKKVQDDQEFDITQGELLGSLFVNLSTIRVVQASKHPNIRDSVPPTSALRFDPSTSRKREREEIRRSNGCSEAGDSSPNKRQRVLGLDPDEPLPSREIETNGRKPSPNPTSGSQPNSISRTSDGIHSHPRYVKKVPPRISETPSPPLPSLGAPAFTNNGITNQPNDQCENTSLINTVNNAVHADRSPRVRQASQRIRPHKTNPSEGESAGYHSPQNSERGGPVPPTTTSPLSVDQQGSVGNGVAARSRHTRLHLKSPAQNDDANVCLKENSIYENITSDDEGSAILRAKRAALRQKSSPVAGLPGLEWAKKKLNTTPNGSSRGSGGRDSVTTGKSPVVTGNKKREQSRSQGVDDEVVASVEAVEPQTREANDSRESRATRSAQLEIAKGEERERVDIGELKQGNSEHQTAVEKADRLHDEKEASAKIDIENQKRRETSLNVREKASPEQLNTENAAKVKSKRVRDVKEDQEKILAEAQKLKEVHDIAQKTRLPSSSPIEARPPKSSPPILPQGTPGSRPQSGTPFIPHTRKSALKGSISSQVVKSSSPSRPSPSPDMASTGVVIETQMPLPRANRRVSFQKEVIRDETPIPPPPRRILPPAKTYASSAITPKKSNIKPIAKTPIVQAKAQSPSTAILPLKVQSMQRNITPTLNSMAAPTTTKVIPSPKQLPPSASATKIPPPASQVSKSATPIRPPQSKERSKSSSIEPPKREPPSRDSLFEAMERSSQQLPMKKAQDLDTSVKANAVAEHLVGSESDDEKDQDIDEDETPSDNSSPRDSRSPVSFSQHTKTTEVVTSLTIASSPSDISLGDEEMLDIDDVNEPAIEGKEQPSLRGSVQEVESEFDASDSEDEQDVRIQVPKSSPPVLPRHKPSSILTNLDTTLVNSSKGALLGKGLNTQDQIDQQLTSSMYDVHSSLPAASTPTPVPSSSTAIRPPTIKFGASLSSLNQNRLSLGASSQLKPNIARNGQPWPKFSLAKYDEEGGSEESDSDDDTSSSSSDDEDTIPVEKKTIKPAPGPRKYIKNSLAAASDSDGSDEEEEEEEETEKSRARDELIAQVANMTASSQGSVIIQSPKAYTTNTQQRSIQKGKGQNVEKKNDKFVAGYKFSMPA